MKLSKICACPKVSKGADEGNRGEDQLACGFLVRARPWDWLEGWEAILTGWQARGLNSLVVKSCGKRGRNVWVFICADRLDRRAVKRDKANVCMCG